MHFLFSPLTWALLYAVILALGWLRLSRLWRAALMIFECVLIISMTPLGANALVWLVESRVRPTDACALPVPTTIVVLAAGFDHEPANTHDFSALDADNFSRAISGAAMWRGTPDATLVIAGGGPYPISESIVLREFVQQLGVPERSVRVESRSRTTWENASELRAMGLPARIRLVSSALHLPRALVAFQAAGFDA